MSYDYATQRPRLFTEEGQEMFTKMRDRALQLIAAAGAVRMEKLMAGLTGETWDMLACADRMIERGDIIEVSQTHSPAGQHRIFTRLEHLHF